MECQAGVAHTLLMRRGDAGNVQVVIGVVAVQPTFSYVAVPRASPRAYLVAHANNQSPYPLLPGAMQVRGCAHVGLRSHTFVPRVCSGRCRLVT